MDKKRNRKVDKKINRKCGDCEYMPGCSLWNHGQMFETDASGCANYTPIKSCSAYFIGFMDGRMQNTNQFVIEQLRDLADRLEKASQTKKTLSACLNCKKRKECLDTVQAHAATDECYEEELT